MEKYKGKIPIEIAKSLCDFYNNHNKDKVLTLPVLRFFLSQGATCVVSKDADVVMAMSLYLIYQSDNNKSRVINNNDTRDTPIFRKPVSVKDKLSPIKSQESSSGIRFRLVIFECYLNSSIVYPEKTILHNLVIGSSKNIAIYTANAKECKETLYRWEMKSEGIYSLYYHETRIANAIICTGSLDNKLSVNVLSIDILDDRVMSLLPLLAHAARASTISVPICTGNEEVEGIPAIKPLIAYKHGFSVKYYSGALRDSEASVSIKLPFVL